MNDRRQEDDWETGMQRRSGGTTSSHRDGQTGTRKCEGRTHGQEQKAEMFSRNMTRQERWGQAGSATVHQFEKYWKVFHVKVKIRRRRRYGDECVERKSLYR